MINSKHKEENNEKKYFVIGKILKVSKKAEKEKKNFRKIKGYRLVKNRRFVNGCILFYEKIKILTY